MKLDRKINNKELSTRGLVIEGVEILPPMPTTTLSQLCFAKKIPHFKIAGKIYYQVSELQEWVQNTKREVAN